MKKVFYTVMAVSALTFFSCSSDTPEIQGGEPGSDNGGEESVENPRYYIELSAAEKAAADYQNDFSFRFLAEAEKRGHDQLVLSPISLSMWMTTVSNGAAGESKAQIVRALGCDPDDVESLNRLNIKLLEELPEVDKETIVELSNSIWLDYGFTVKQTFIDNCMDACKAEFYDTDLYSGECVAAINQWCKDKTHGLIEDAVSNPMYSDVEFLNATYFKGLWTNKFDKDCTKEEEFRNLDGSVSTVDMMNQEVRCEYSEIGDIQLLRMPYGNGAYSMYIAMADREIFAEEMYDAFKNAEFTLPIVKLKMPRMDFKSEISDKIIMDMLSSMGVVDIFDPLKADMTAMSDKNMAIGGVAQIAVIKVDEEGTEAAAITSLLGILGDEQAAPERKEFYMNKPFTFFIQENSAGVVLFMGKVRKF